MPYKQIQRNRPISTLIRWYSDKKSGKVTDARYEIQKRFDYLDWPVQKRIILAFLQSGKSDREWAYGKIYQQWDDCYLEPMKALWEKYHEKVCAWSVIQHFPLEYVRNNVDPLEEVNGYYHLCQRLAEDPTYQIDRSKLQGKEYLLVMLNTHRKVSEEDARDIFFHSLHKFCLTEPRLLFRVYHRSRGSAFSVDDIAYMSSLLYILRLLGLDDVARSIEKWNEQVMFAMYQGEELKSLDKEAISDDEYNEKRIAIGLRYLYHALDDKYKKPTDEQYLSKYDEDESSTDASEILEKMMAKNPAVAQLVSSFTLAGQSEEANEDLPF